jgi:predicted protein tyrosine phosphatase
MLIHVCSLKTLAETTERVSPSRLLSLVKMDVTPERPEGMPAAHHLHLSFNDIVEEAVPGQIAPSSQHVAEILRFVGGWDHGSPMLIHCWAGISRSTAAAAIAVAALRPDVSAPRIAEALRAASPTATPNIRLIALADRALGRAGRLEAAIRAIGRGAEAGEGIPFFLNAAHL